MVNPRSRSILHPRRCGRSLALALALAGAALYSGLAAAQNTVTLGASVTSGNGQLTTDITWSTNPPLTTGTPCVASGHANWTGAKAGSGSQTVTISTSGTLPLSLTCTFPGTVGIAEFSWTPATTNTDGSNYVNRNFTRLRYTFNPTLPTNPLPACNTGGVVCVDVPDDVTPRPTMRTVTGLTTVGTLRAVATHVNSVNAESGASNAVTKVFTGAVPVTQSVSITVNPVPNAPSNLVLP